INGGKTRIGLAGGAVLSDQEREWIAANPNTEAPGNLFYHLMEEQLKSGSDLQFDYDLEMGSPSYLGFQDNLGRNLVREFGEELGANAASLVRLGCFLPGERITTL